MIPELSVNSFKGHKNIFVLTIKYGMTGLDIFRIFPCLLNPRAVTNTVA